MARFTLLSTYYYKGRKIERIEDRWRQEFVIVDGSTAVAYASLADAKRAINGIQTIWEPFLDVAR